MKTNTHNNDSAAQGTAASSHTTAIVPVTSTPDPKVEFGALKRYAIRMLGGDIFAQKFLRRNWAAIALILFLTMVYISNRYMAEQEMIRISDLQRELNEVRFRALTHSSELTRRCRQSNIENALRAAGDTTLLPAREAPFIIRVNH